MSLRTRLFLVVGGLVVLVVGAQWWWMGRLADELGQEVDEVAFSVGQSVAKVLVAPIRGENMTWIQCVDGDCREGTVDGPADVHWVELGEELDPGRIHERLEHRLEDGQVRRSRRVVEQSFIIVDGEGAVEVEGDHGSDRPPAERLDLVRVETEVSEIGDGAPENGPGDGYAYWFGDLSPGGDEGARLVHRGVVDVAARTGGGDHGTAHDGHPADLLVEGEMDAEAVHRMAFHLVHQDETPIIELAGPNVSHQIQIPRQGLSDKLAELRRRTLVGSLGILLLALLLTGVVAHRITAPLRRLAEAARRVGEGDWGTRVDVEGGGEVGQAIVAFNQMSGRLAELDERTRDLEAHRHLGEIGEIARGLAHSLRNPLNALGLTLEELAGGGTAGDGDVLVVAARRQIRRIDHNIRSFLALASQGGGVVTTVSLGDLVQDVALEALQDAQGKARIEVEGCADESHDLQAVEPELRAVVQALLVNAVEASPEGGLVRAELMALADGRLRLVIEDQGPGLSEEIRSRLFTPHLSTKSHGSGMGLFLAHRIATNRYGGKLVLEDGQHGGTRAVLDLDERRLGEER